MVFPLEKRVKLFKLSIQLEKLWFNFSRKPEELIELSNNAPQPVKRSKKLGKQSLMRSFQLVKLRKQTMSTLR
jgi:hypothetical protein